MAYEEQIVEERPEEITTLHVSSLPTDFKERELFLVYGPMRGFKNGQLKFTPGKVLGFVTFDSRESAREALERTNGLSWTGSLPEFSLRVAFAAKQTRNIKSDRSIVSNHSQQSKQSLQYGGGYGQRRDVKKRRG